MCEWDGLVPISWSRMRLTSITWQSSRIHVSFSTGLSANSSWATVLPPSSVCVILKAWSGSSSDGDMRVSAPIIIEPRGGS